MEALRALADELNIRTADKLHRAAQARGLGTTRAQAGAALSTDAAKQVLAPKVRPQGKSTAEEPNFRLQADLIDFSQNTRADRNQGHKYAVQLTDVYTRQTHTKAVPNKTPGVVGPALQDLVENAAGPPAHGYVVTTDEGGEFSRLHLPNGGVHRVKQAGDTNAMGVLDRSMQTIKQDLALRVGRHGGGWAQHLQQVTDAYNHRYNSAVHGEPATAGEENEQSFLIMQDNASKFLHNRDLTQQRVARLADSGTYRAPVADAGRSYYPRFGQKRQLAGVKPGAGSIVDTQGRETLLKQAQPVPAASGEPMGRLRDTPTKASLRPLAVEIATAMRQHAAKSDLEMRQLYGHRLQGRGPALTSLLRSFPDLFGRSGGRWHTKHGGAAEVQRGFDRLFAPISRRPPFPAGSMPLPPRASSEERRQVNTLFGAPAPAPRHAPAPRPLRPVGARPAGGRTFYHIPTGTYRTR